MSSKVMMQSVTLTTTTYKELSFQSLPLERDLLKDNTFINFIYFLCLMWEVLDKY